jgi:membrane protease YdiL (CAAX protease family)
VPADAQTISPLLQELLLTLLAWGLFAITLGPLLIFLWRYWPPRQRVWPAQRQRLVTWTPLDLGLVLLLYLLLPAMVALLLLPWFPTAAYARIDIADTLSQVGITLAGGNAGAPAWYIGDKVHELDAGFRMVRLALYAEAVGAPFFVLAAIGVLRLRTGALPLQMGLSLLRWRADLLAGFWGWFFLVPLCFTLFYVVQLPALEDFIGQTTPHPIHYLIAAGPSISEWILILFLTVLVAPVTEEILVRGVVQPLMVKNPLLADSTIITSLIMAIMLGLVKENNSTPWMPILFLVSVALGYLAFEWLMQPWLPRPGAARAIFASSLLFAAMHAQVWPTPIPLFFLALGLGFVAYRTQSLWGSMFLHSLFNLLNFLPLLLAQWLK